MAFVTSKGTMDKANPSVRKYIAERAELLGAVRLPNDAFQKNAGTEVTTDIIFLRKRERPPDVDQDWVHLGLTNDGIPVNSYYVQNPEMILGKMVREKSMYGGEDETACLPMPGANLAEQLFEAVGKINGKLLDNGVETEGHERESIPADALSKVVSSKTIGSLHYTENTLLFLFSILGPPY